MKDKRRIIAIFIIVAIVAALAAVATFFVIKSAKNEAKGSSQMTETATEDSSDKEDPQHTGDNAGSMSVTTDEGASADETQILSASTVAENSNLTFGIDVSKYQGTIKWDKVAAGGIDFRRGGPIPGGQNEDSFRPFQGQEGGGRKAHHVVRLFAGTSRCTLFTIS